jgi:GR25 family glycosyltransferase involved in LPS biosynthesis
MALESNGDTLASVLGPGLSQYIPLFEEEELTPALLRSFRPWPKALHAALDELGVTKLDAPLIVDALSAKGAPRNDDSRTSSSAASFAPAAPCAATQRTSSAPRAPPLSKCNAATEAPFAAVYINLAARTDRRRAVELSLAKAGIQAERFEALRGASAGEDEVRTTWDTSLNAKFDRNTKVQSDLAMSDGERGCAASHLALWRRCVERNGPLLVLEDDLDFADSSEGAPTVGDAARALVATLGAALEPSERTLLLYLGADAYLRDGAPSLRGQQASWAARGANVPVALKESKWAWQTHAYVIWPAAARVLLQGLPIDAPVDVYLSRHFHERKICGLVCEPELCRQLDPYHGGDVFHSSLGDRQKMPGWSAATSAAVEARRPRW